MAKTKAGLGKVHSHPVLARARQRRGGRKAGIGAIVKAIRVVVKALG